MDYRSDWSFYRHARTTAFAPLRRGAHKLEGERAHVGCKCTRSVHGIRRSLSAHNRVSGRRKRMPWREAFNTGGIRLKLHANARTCPHCRSLIVMRVLEDRQSPSKVATDFRVSHRTVHKWIRRYKAEGMSGLKDKTSAPHTVPRKLVQPGKELTDAVMALLHAPPSQSGFNRTTWRMGDLRNVLAERGIATTLNSIRTVIRRAGVRWSQARISLTSTDPDYRKKLDAIKSVLANLGTDDAFFPSTSWVR